LATCRSAEGRALRSVRRAIRAANRRPSGSPVRATSGPATARIST